MNQQFSKEIDQTSLYSRLKQQNQNNIYDESNLYYDNTLQVAQNCLDEDDQMKDFQTNKIPNLKKRRVNLSVDFRLTYQNQMNDPKNTSNLSFINLLQDIQEKNEENEDENEQNMFLFTPRGKEQDNSNTQNMLLNQSQNIFSDRSHKKRLSQALLNDNSFISSYDSHREHSSSYYNQSTGQTSNSGQNKTIIFQNSIEANINSDRKHDFITQISKNSSNRKNMKVSILEQAKYEIQIDKINQDPRTTLMMKNIPNQYSQQLLRDKINQNFKNKYDFFYLPMDFKNNCNMGYAFINLYDSKCIKDFYNHFHNHKWQLFKSGKVCEIRYATIQGITNLQYHFKDTNVYTKREKEVQPFILNSNQISQIEQIINQQKNSNKY